MIEIFKGLLPGAGITYAVAGAIGHGGGTGGFLKVYHESIQHYDFFWSWTLFCIMTGLFALIFKMMD